MSNLDVIFDTYTLALSRTERVLVRLLHEHGALTRDQLIAFLYEPGRSPDRPDDALRVAMYQLRNRLGVAGWTVTSNKGGRGNMATYQLEKLERGHVETAARATARIVRKDYSTVWGEDLSVLQAGDDAGEAPEEEE